MSFTSRDPDATRRTGPGDEPPDLAEMLVKVGRCRGYTLNCGVLAVLCATSESEEELQRHSDEFQSFRSLFVGHVASNAAVSDYLTARPDLAAPVGIIQKYHADITDIGDDVVRLSRRDAIELARRSRQDVLPALYTVIAAFEASIAEEARADLARVAEKADLVDGMLTEMGRIGRMIGLISINASVEAARAGGASGRSFQVIAEEVRSLARQSSDLLERMKKRIAEDDASDRARKRRIFT